MKGVQRRIGTAADILVSKVDQREGCLVVSGVSVGSDRCPDCGQPSSSRKGAYMRHLQDLPVQGMSVRIEVRVTRWSCANSACARHSFAERIENSALRHARRTRRVSELARWIGHATGGRSAERLLLRLGIPHSDDTILRLLKREAARRTVPVLRVVGIDDWSWQRGRSYGTILVDLERREVVDVLADRSAETTARWLQQHPEIEVVSRDRCGLYAQAARRGAPMAKQVADRFHLLQNLRETIENQLSRSYRPASTPAASGPGVVNMEASAGANSHGRQPELLQHRIFAGRGRRAVWLQSFERVTALQREGKGTGVIARETRLNWRTVAKWALWDELPERRRMDPRLTAPIRFESHLAKRWADGFRTARHLLPEIQKLGYAGSLTHLERLLSQWRRTGHGPSLQPLCADDVPTGTEKQCHIPPIAASHLCMKPRGLMGEQEREKVAQLKATVHGFDKMRELSLRFRGILKGRDVAKLDAWLDNAHRSGLYGMRRFAYTVRNDLAAVQNAIREHWSNGQTEGQINRLKTLKRAMYGRAGTELLRARLLPLPPEKPALGRIQLPTK
jgi:transposase